MKTEPGVKIDVLGTATQTVRLVVNLMCWVYLTTRVFHVVTRPLTWGTNTSSDERTWAQGMGILGGMAAGLTVALGMCPFLLVLDLIGVGMNDTFYGWCWAVVGVSALGFCWGNIRFHCVQMENRREAKEKCLAKHTPVQNAVLAEPIPEPPPIPTAPWKIFLQETVVPQLVTVVLAIGFFGWLLYCYIGDGCPGILSPAQ
jgi:hypothetical protein